MASNRVLVGLLVVNLLVTAALAVWVISVATGKDSWLPATVSLREQVEELEDDVEDVDGKAQAAGELAAETCDGAQDTVGQLQGWYDIEVYAPGCGPIFGGDPYDFRPNPFG